MIGDDTLPPGGVPDALGHPSPNRRPVEAVFLCRPVAAQYPNNVWLVLVAVTDPTAVPVGIDAIKDHGTGSPAFRDLVAPGRKQRHEKPARPGHLYHAVNQLEVCLIWPVGIVVFKRQPAIPIRPCKAVEFCEHHRLYHVKSFCLPVIEVGADLAEREAMEQFPAGIAQPKERRAVSILQEMPIRGDFQPAVRPWCLRDCADGQTTTEKEWQ